MKVLITGGAGYIGSHTAVELIEAGCRIVIADNFSNSSLEAVKRIRTITDSEVPCYFADLRREETVTRIFRNERPDAVIHFAGLKAVGESNEQPVAYFDHNLGTMIQILKAMRAFNCLNLVFSSSATVYGDGAQMPVTEDAPLLTTNPYGRTKKMIEEMLMDTSAAYPEMCITALRYFNPIGAHRSGLIGEDPLGIPNNLAPFVTQVAAGRRGYLQVFGNDYETADGTGIRDYIHVQDLARGHIAAINKGKVRNGYHVYNLGTGYGTSVLELVHMFRFVSGRKIPYVITKRRPGDAAVSFANTCKAEKELGWKAMLGLEDMCRDSWNWQQKNPAGYRSDNMMEVETS
ncbi:UDP-glucose 4-epimerase GalE [Alkalicoccus luteus]|uniref:UDP-glucose 4-epimerase n=1 Tax=Alkalicoccus luteus TaxID=1237094 RepID=A0A969TVV2_9BACI|nr:UDP-glucose 4-epimerase GalE [Alkalicoccus luteus]NJP38785.1 UDP-glucose 4-epimerase GalE [Alkalicoccus luteus]